jgi:hypothetical protein
MLGLLGFKRTFPKTSLVYIYMETLSKTAKETLQTLQSTGPWLA